MRAMADYPRTRRAAVAGSWYPGEPRALGGDVDRYLAGVSGDMTHQPLGVIAPHAGLMFSGPVAAHAYAACAQHMIDVAVLVGPSHYVGFDGVAVYPEGSFDTPLGPADIDTGSCTSLEGETACVVRNPAAHAREHSLEMQLPFLKRVLPDTRIVPLVMGHQRRAIVYELGRALGAVFAGKRVLFVASTDLSHYESATRAAALDAEVIRHVEGFDPDGLMAALEKFPNHACGGGPTVSVMLAARALGARAARVFKYADSGDVSGDKSSVVGYLAAGLY
jgi:AmmeMemoRadiSam system protein B